MKNLYRFESYVDVGDHINNIKDVFQDTIDDIGAELHHFSEYDYGDFVRELDNGLYYDIYHLDSENVIHFIIASYKVIEETDDTSVTWYSWKTKTQEIKDKEDKINRHQILKQIYSDVESPIYRLRKMGYKVVKRYTSHHSYGDLLMISIKIGFANV